MRAHEGLLGFMKGGVLEKQNSLYQPSSTFLNLNEP